MLKTMISLTGFFLLGAALMPAYAHDQHIGFVDVSQVMLTIPEAKAVRAKLDKLWDKRKTALRKIEDDMTVLRKLWDERLEKHETLSNAVREKDNMAVFTDLEKVYSKLEDKYYMTASRYEGEIDWLDYQFRRKFYKTLNAAISRVEKNKHLDNVLGCYVEGCAEQATTFSSDVTLDVIKALMEGS